MKRRPRRQPWVTLLLSVATAVALVAVLYVALTSLPYLATSPTSDAQFGAFNACLLREVPQRVGFAVGPPGAGVAAWSDHGGAWCLSDGGAIRLPDQPFVTAALTASRLWLATREAVLQIDSAGTRVGSFAVSASSLSSFAEGVLALENGRLVALAADGSVTGTASLGTVVAPQVMARPEGDAVVLRQGSRVLSFLGPTLVRTADVVPCEVLEAWLLPGEPLAVFRCAGGWAVRLELASGQLVQHEGALPPSGSTRSWPGYVQACDTLPCLAR